mgnify:CR=1 FL=1
MLVEYEELYNAYLDCRKHKRSSANCQQFEIDRTRNLWRLWKDLNSGKYEIGRSIAFIVHHPKDREVFAADFRDRIVHHLIIRRIEKLLEDEFIADSYSCRKKKGTLYGIKRCEMYMRQISENYTKDAYILKGDLRSFFMTIDIRKMYDTICNLLETRGNFDADTLDFLKHTIKQIAFNRPQTNCILKQSPKEWDCLPRSKSLFYCDPWHGLPIGNLTSQIFANLFMSDFDHYVTHNLGFRAYGRYVDDFYIISRSKEDIKRALPLIRASLNKKGVSLHPDKIYFQSVHKGVLFLGQIIKPFGRMVKRQTMGNLYIRLHSFYNFFAWHEAHNKLLNDDDLEYMISSINSYYGYLRQARNFKTRKQIAKSALLKPLLAYAHFDVCYNKLIKNKIYIGSHKHINKHFNRKTK